MLAFTNTEVSKAQLVASLEKHAAADRIVSGDYWDESGGCAIGCSIHDFRPGEEHSHIAYESLFGIPEVIARLEDSIFERLPNEEQKQWPLRLAQSVREGANLTHVWDRFALWLLVDPVDGVVNFTKHEPVLKAIELVSALYQRRIEGDEPTTEEWDNATEAALTHVYNSDSTATAQAALATAATANAAATAIANTATAAAHAAVNYAAHAAYVASNAQQSCEWCDYAIRPTKNMVNQQAKKLIELIEAC